MWKKDEARAGQPGAGTPAAPAAAVTEAKGGSRAVIGPSISIRGEVTGSEDLLIQGRVEGSVSLELHAVRVGDGGHVSADIAGRVITVDGTVDGDLTATEQIVLRGSARVRGDIEAPRVVLEDGATFRGMVEMGSPSEREDAAAKPGGDATDAVGEASRTAEAGGKPNGAGERPGTATERTSPPGGRAGSASARQQPAPEATDPAAG